MLLERRLGGLLSFEREAREELAGREAELARLNERLREDSRRDPLTGLRNRRALVEDLPDVELDARRRGQSIAIAICDVDRFKAYNDKLGHIAGDQALRAIAATVRMQLRAGDAAYRYGGEELVLVLRDAERPRGAGRRRARARGGRGRRAPAPGRPARHRHRLDRRRGRQGRRARAALARRPRALRGQERRPQRRARRGRRGGHEARRGAAPTPSSSRCCATCAGCWTSRAPRRPDAARCPCSRRWPS